MKKGIYPVTDIFLKRSDCNHLDTVGSAFFTLAQSDVTGNGYKVANNRNNYLTITYYDAATNEIQGNLDIAYREPLYPAADFSGTYGDTIFVKGSFKIRKL